MFRIRRIFDDVIPANQNALEQVRAILRSQFELLDRQKIDRIPELLRDPLKYRFRSILYVAEDHSSTVRGLAMLDHDADLKFCYLDYLASDRKLAGRGVGGALYDRIRSEAYGARPIVNTAHETPVHNGSDNPPYLVFDKLAQDSVLRKSYLKQVIACILERKYGDIC